MSRTSTSDAARAGLGVRAHDSGFRPEGLSPIHIDTQTMATKTVNLTEGAYARLKALKREGESFSDVVDRLTGKFALLDLVGILDEASTRRLRRAKQDVRARLRKGVEAKRRGVG